MPGQRSHAHALAAAALLCLLAPLAALGARSASHSHRGSSSARSPRTPAAVAPDPLPDSLQQELSDPQAGADLQQAAARAQPQAHAVVGYLTAGAGALEEFRHMMYASWRHVHVARFAAAGSSPKLDLLVFAEEDTCAQHMPPGCQLLDLLRAPGESGAAASRLLHAQPQCLFVPWPPLNMTAYYGYIYANSWGFLAHPVAAAFLAAHYARILRSDFDVFLTPGLLDYRPARLVSGVGGYCCVGTPDTGARLRAVAGRLRMRHQGVHNVGSTMFGPPAAIYRVARLVLPLVPYLLSREFEQRPDGGGPVHLLDGVGWAEGWYAGVTLLYAGELAMNHLLTLGPEWEMSNGTGSGTRDFGLDSYSTHTLPVASAYAIHVWHTNEPFSKFKFAEHHYTWYDTSRMNTSVIREYCMYIAVSSYRSGNWRRPLPWPSGMAQHSTS